MNTVIKFNSFISILLLFSLFTLFNEVTALAIQNRAGVPENFCDGFGFTTPKAGAELINGTETNVVWTKGKSLVTEIYDLELFNENGDFVSSLWDKGISFGSGEEALLSLTLEVPSSATLPGKFMFRSWATHDGGPDCFRLSEVFTINP
ncbi:3150_t:CDS:2 [Funneliformis geosporum]|uniref:623_t:CDS:1 n=1 Tax=Funneliformis geosporum TaxID=1117311 RepID=A0A9W4SI59_9GLOM|nr:3150_t:CDS:2 [Funneliformis geosporum]CAI2169946.1 623_t:CDS:2 [Funneliformis geosporum]